MFNLLVTICEGVINVTPLNRDRGVPNESHLKNRFFGPRGILAMMVKYLTSSADPKDLYVQSGATSNVFRQGVELGMVAIIANMSHPQLRMF